MSLNILPVFRKVWVEALKRYMPTTEIIGYQAVQAGKVLGYGKTRAEAAINGIEELRAARLSAVDRVKVPIVCVC